MLTAQKPRAAVLATTAKTSDPPTMMDDLWQKLLDLFNTAFFTVGKTPVTALGLIRIVVILVIAFWISKMIRHGLSRVSRR